MLLNNSTGSISLLTIDTTTAAPQNAASNVLVINGTGGIVLPKGTTAQQPTNVHGLLRYNTDNSNVEVSDAAAWHTIARFTDIAATVTASYVRTTLGLDSVYLQSANLNTAIDARVTQSYITTLVDTVYVNISGDTMTGPLILNANPANALGAATKQYVDSLVSSGTVWRSPIVTPDLLGIVAGNAEPATKVAETAYIVTSSGTWTGSLAVALGDVVEWNGTSWIKLKTLTTGDRFIIAGEYGAPAGVTVDASITGMTVSGTALGKSDLIQFVFSGTYAQADLTTASSWSEPDGIATSAGNTMAQGVTVLSNVITSSHYGHTYLYSATTFAWTEIAGPGSVGAGTGLHYVGSALTLDIPVAIAHGGTGLTAAGTADQILGVVNAGGALEYKSIVGTANQIGVTHTANTITLTNLGLLSIAASTGTTGLTLTPTTTNGAVTQVLAGTLVVANGGTGLTAAPTNGQLLIGNGTGYTLAVPTAGTGISVTTGAGSLTIANTGVTSVDVSGGTTGLTTTGGPVTTTGTITLAGTLAATHGGTGLSSLGTANQVLGINAGATATEYKTITAGTAVSVTHGVGSITIDNTGVTSAVAGTGISVSNGTGAVTISNTGVTNVTLSTVSPNGGGTNVSGILINGVEGTTTLATGSVSTTGTITIALDNALQSLANLTSSGIISADSGTYVSRIFVGGATNTITVTNGDGVLGNPTFDLATIGTPVSASHVKITTNAYGQVTATTAVTSSDITTSLGYTPVNKAGDTVTGTLTFSAGTVTGLATPTAATDAATKAYVDAAASSLVIHNAVQFTTTTADVYTVTYNNGTAGVGATLTNAGTLAAFSIDGKTPAINDRVLIKNQASAVQNGIYTVTTVGSGSVAWVLTRATDADNSIGGNSANEVHAGLFVFVADGNTLSKTGWVQTTIGTGTGEQIVIGTDTQVWTQFSGAGSYSAGTGLTLTGSTFSLTSPVALALGGTGLTTGGTANQILGENATGTGLEYKTVTAGTGISVTHVAGSITIDNTGILSVSAGTTGLSFSTVAGAATLSGTLAIANGGTGQTTAQSAFDALAPSQTANSGKFLTTNGTTTSWAAAVSSITGDAGTATGLTLTVGGTSAVPTLTLGGTLHVASGGTGLSAAGTSGQVLGVSATTGVLEYKSLTAGTGITIDSTTTPGVITISSSGGSVTSVGLSAPSIFTVTNSPVTSTGTLTFSLNTQAANTVFAGPASGADAAPTFRSLAYLDLPIKLYTENPSTPTANTVTGANAVAIGSGASATGADTLAIGTGSSANQAGGVAIANGGTAGSAQTGIYALRNTTTTASTANLYLDGATTQVLIANNSMMTFVITIAALGSTDQAAFKLEGGIIKGATAGSTTVIGTQKTVLAKTAGATAWDVAVVADTTNGALQVQVTGATTTTIKWVATVVSTEVL